MLSTPRAVANGPNEQKSTTLNIAQKPATLRPAQQMQQMQQMQLYVGTSGFSYKEWKGKFYPEDLPEKQMLRFYSERFNSVEINNTFYRMPKPELLEGWAKEVPENFRFGLLSVSALSAVSIIRRKVANCLLPVFGGSSPSVTCPWSSSL